MSREPMGLKAASWRGQVKLPRANYRRVGLDRRQQRGRRRREARAVAQAIAAVAAEYRARGETFGV